MMPHISRITVAAFVAALLLTAATVDARPITLVWDASPDPSVAGYIVSYGTEPGTYSDSIDVGNLISWQVDLPGAQYYFAVRAYDADRNLSEFSLEVGDTEGVLLTNPGDQFSAAGDVVTLQLVATGSPVAYSAINLPPGLSIDPATGRISGVVGPAAEPSSSHIVTTRVSDPSGTSRVSSSSGP